MNINAPIRTPYHQLPITIINAAMKQKVYRHFHCPECGMPIADITDKVVVMYDGATEFDSLIPEAMGIVEIHCPRSTCKQYYRMEFVI